MSDEPYREFATRGVPVVVVRLGKGQEGVVMAGGKDLGIGVDKYSISEYKGAVACGS
ncbi:MAG: hypothetical protein HN919_05245 [Verrucomicrobia bacterium]|jgi:hypothetical protein|nr:hypothetical protein [Verrucomicrobiota bacterium]